MRGEWTPLLDLQERPLALSPARRPWRGGTTQSPRAAVVAMPTLRQRLRRAYSTSG